MPVFNVALRHRLLGLVHVADRDGGEGQVVQHHVLGVDAHDHGGHAPLGVHVQDEESRAHK